MWGLLLCGGWLLATGYLVGATGSCWHQCCPGRNNTCWAPGARQARCYCDSYCERTGDCCQDYRAACHSAGERWDGVALVGPPAGDARPGLLLLVASVCCSVSPIL